MKRSETVAPPRRRSPARLAAVGAGLLWVVTPLLLGGLITLAVRSHNGGGIGLGVGFLLVLGGVVALFTLLGGFAALVAAVLTWARSRRGALVQADRFEEERARGVEHHDSAS